jgi:hypothetical protein
MKESIKVLKLCFIPLSLRLQEICYCTKSPKNVAEMEGKSFPDESFRFKQYDTATYALDKH